MWPDQFELPSASKAMVMVGRTSVTSAISMRPISSGKKRSRATSVLGGERRMCRRAGRRGCTSSKRTLPVGNSDTATAPRSTGSSPVTARICGLDGARARCRPGSAATSAKARQSPTAKTAATASPRRLMPTAAVTTRLSSLAAMRPTNYSEADRGATWQAFCDPFVAGDGRYRRIRAFRVSIRPHQRVGISIASPRSSL